MEKELNIAAILKEKPKGLKLWSPIFGECEVRHINDDIDDSVSVVSTYSLSSYEFIKDGRASEKGEMCLFPSKLMRDWSKFAWKKGDVLVAPNGEHCFFYEWLQDDYDKFEGWYPSDNGSTKNYTFQWKKETDEEAIKEYIKEIEDINEATLNLETLEFEEQPKQEFKDGDIVYLNTKNGLQYVFAYDANKEMITSYIVAYCITLEEFAHIETQYICGDNMINSIHLATDSEKQQLYSALAKEGKVWNSETKQIEDLPKKCEFKTLDYVLMKTKGFNGRWLLAQYSFSDSKNVYFVGGMVYCIDEVSILPYNDSTKHLLGTADECEGGEV